MKDKSILLLGGGGFLGLTLARHLERHGWIVHIVSRSLAATCGNSVIIHQGDMADKPLIEKILSRCNIVIHLASATTPGSSAGNPLLEIDMNVVPTLKFLTYFRDSEARWMVFISSGGTLYGNSITMPVNEKHTLEPLSYHGAGKMAIEAFLQAFSHETGKHITILRPSNLYGPGQALRQGFGFIRTVLEHLRKDTEMEIWGDGNIVRDFLYIQDMIKNIELIINSDPHTDVYNVGYGKGYSLNDVIQTIEKVCGKTLKVNYLPARQADVQRVILDSSKIRRKLAWAPEISLEEGVGLTWQWMLQ